jgi:hypothetical protein
MKPSSSSSVYLAALVAAASSTVWPVDLFLTEVDAAEKALTKVR